MYRLSIQFAEFPFQTTETILKCGTHETADEINRVLRVLSGRLWKRFTNRSKATKRFVDSWSALQ
jgi:hypothetical protein